jgi:hypothetical protein
LTFTWKIMTNLEPESNLTREASSPGRGKKPNQFGHLIIPGLAILGLAANPTRTLAEPTSTPNAGGEAKAMSEPRYLLFWRAPEQVPELVRQLGSKGDGRARLLGFGVPTSPFDEEKQLPARIHAAFTAGRTDDLAVMLAFDFHIGWRRRPDLWNWFDPNKPGYSPANRRNVEWFGWDGPPAKTRYLNWGVPERMAPPPCLTSAAYRSEVSRLVRDVIAPPLKEELAVLQREGKGRLFAGVLVGAEPGIEDYSNPDPQTAKLMAEDGAPRGQLGYRALLDRGYAPDKPPARLHEALGEVIQETVGFWCRQFVEAGMPPERLYPHVVAQIADPSSAPVSAAFNAWSRPGWSTYPAGCLTTGFGVLYAELQKQGNPPWGGVEANAGCPGGAVDWETYLGWHYNHGAVLVAINTGATGQELPDRLEKSAFGQEALAAYHKFLAGEPLREKPVTDIPQLRLPPKMAAVQAGFKAWQEAGRDPAPIGRYVEERLPPLMQAGRLSEAEAVLDEALRRLAAPPAPAAAGAVTTGK